MHDLWLHACILILVVGNLVRVSLLRASRSLCVNPNLGLVLTANPDPWTRQDSLVPVAQCLDKEVRCQAASLLMVWDQEAFHPVDHALAVYRLKDVLWELLQAELQGPEVPLLNTAISLEMATHSKVTSLGEQWPV